MPPAPLRLMIFRAAEARVLSHLSPDASHQFRISMKIMDIFCLSPPQVVVPFCIPPENGSDVHGTGYTWHFPSCLLKSAYRPFRPRSL